MEMLLQDKTIVITGATSGIGLAVAESVVRQGAWLIGVGRSRDRCDQAQDRLRALRPDDGHIAFCVADLSLQTEVRQLAHEIRATLGGWGRASLDHLVNNAATVPFWQTLTAEGFDMQWAVNHLAPFLLTHELLPLLQAAPEARVVTVSSGSHFGTKLNWEDLQLRRHYNALRAYQQSKLANVLFSAEFNRRLGRNSSIRAYAADPGLVNTELGSKSNSFLARFVWSWRRRGGAPPEESAKGIVYLLAEPSIRDTKHIYWKDARPKSPSSYALNPQAARQLWDLSLAMCGLSD